MVEVQAEIAANVWQVPAEEGQMIAEGETIAILESMKMEIPVEAPVSGTITEIRVAPEDQVRGRRHRGDRRLVIRTERRDQVALVTIDRPERRNALDLEHCRELHRAVTDATADARVVVVTGAGGHFCAGADLGGVEGVEFVAALRALLLFLTETPVPVVAAVEGPALGAGT